MQVSALKVAFGASVLFHGLAFSVVSWGLREGTGNVSGGRHAGPEPVLEIVLEPESLVPDVPAMPLPVASARAVAKPETPAAPAIKTAAIMPTAEAPKDSPEPAVPDADESLLNDEASSVVPEAVTDLSIEAADASAPAPIDTQENLAGGNEDGPTEVIAGTSVGSVAGGESELSAAGYLSNPKPPYPRQARMHRQQGVVVLGVNVTADGFAAEVRIQRSSSFALLDEAALRAVRRWRFTPARKGARAIACQIDVPVRFELTD
jgi:protein TonB